MEPASSCPSVVRDCCNFDAVTLRHSPTAGGLSTCAGNTKFSTASCPDFAVSGWNSCVSAASRELAVPACRSQACATRRWQVIESAGNICCGGLSNLQAQFDDAGPLLWLLCSCSSNSLTPCAAATNHFNVARMFGFVGAPLLSQLTR